MDVRTTGYKPLVVPGTHAEIIGVHCALPERSGDAPDASEHVSARASDFAADLNGLDVEKIFDGDVSRSRVEQWLSQFDSADRWAVIASLKSFEYIGQRRTLKLCKALHARILSEVKGAPVKYVAFGRPGRSGGSIAYEFSWINSLSADFIDQGDIAGLPPGTVVVLLDDIVATGHQAAHELSRLLGETSGSTDTRRVILGVLAATPEGVRYVEEHGNVEVLAGMVLDSAANPLLSGEHAETVRGVFQRYGARLLPRAPLGYDGGARLIAFRHAAPDNSPPVFWAAAHGWKPLLSRGGSPRTGYTSD